jgi:hypothetical protein
MSLTGPQQVTCKCGVALTITVADTVNAERDPQLRDAVLARSLHTYRCPACNANVYVEATFFYLDLERREFYGVFPEALRGEERACGERVVASFQRALGDGAGATTKALFPAHEFHVRTCFGNEELREKLVIHEAGLLDLPIEVLKSRVLGETILGDKRLPRLAIQTLRLDHIEPDGSLAFAFEQAGVPPRPLEVGMVVSRAQYDEIAAVSWQELLAKYPFASGPHVSLLRLLAHAT